MNKLKKSKNFLEVIVIIFFWIFQIIEIATISSWYILNYNLKIFFIIIKLF